MTAALKGVRVLSLALNLPGPAALGRLRDMGALCIKIEPPAAPGKDSADPMQAYAPPAYSDLHRGIRVVQADLKAESGRRKLARELARADVLITSFRPAALAKLGLDWKSLHRGYPELNVVSIVGWPGAQADVPGHDLTYLAENDLVSGLALPPTLYADMAGALLASEAVLQALMARSRKGTGQRLEVALSQAAAWLAQPRRWGLTTTQGVVGGAHAGYRVYACKDGRVAVAALEPHFAQALCAAAGLESASMQSATAHKAMERWFATQTRRTLDALALQLDLPLHTLGRG